MKYLVVLNYLTVLVTFVASERVRVLCLVPQSCVAVHYFVSFSRISLYQLLVLTRVIYVAVKMWCEIIRLTTEFTVADRGLLRKIIIITAFSKMAAAHTAVEVSLHARPARRDSRGFLRVADRAFVDVGGPSAAVCRRAGWLVVRIFTLQVRVPAVGVLHWQTGSISARNNGDELFFRAKRGVHGGDEGCRVELTVLNDLLAPRGDAEGVSLAVLLRNFVNARRATVVGRTVRANSAFPTVRPAFSLAFL